jgi:tRNA (guanine-N7-)-methyltransferase
MTSPRRQGDDGRPHKILYGRRKGRPLRAAQRELMDDLLPRVGVALEGGDGAIEPQALFGAPADRIWMEIGFGGGEHLAAQAEAHPDVGFIGCEPFQNGVVQLLTKIRDRGLENVRILTDDARLLLARLPAGSVDRVYILFPDPWPKLRHAKRRIVSDAVLDRLAVIVPSGGELRIATDDPGYQTWILEHMQRHRDRFAWIADGPSDWRTRPPDSVETRYEAKAVREGRHPIHLRYRRTDSGG